jgi:polyhydroxybutyrate depolymerase
VTSRRRRVVLIALVATTVVVLCAVAAGFYWGTGPAPRCLLPAEGLEGPGWSARTIASAGRDRCYYIYFPSGYEPDQPLPVVISLHGFLSNPESQALISGWHDLAEREGFLVVYPQATQYPHRWNAGADWGDAGVDDVQFALDLLEDLSSAANVDSSRVYVNGMSNGGGMTVALGCHAADRFAAMGTVAGAVVGLEDCSPSRPIPVMAFHGTADPIVPYEGGDLPSSAMREGATVVGVPGRFSGAEAWVADWAEGKGCDPVPEVIPQQGDVRSVRYTGCDDGAAVILYTIEEGGHTWPGGWPIPAVGKTSTDIDATEEMWRFFQRYRLEGRP